MTKKKYAPLFVSYTFINGGDRKFGNAVSNLNEPVTNSFLRDLEEDLRATNKWSSCMILYFQRLEA